MGSNHMGICRTTVIVEHSHSRGRVYLLWIIVGAFLAAKTIATTLVIGQASAQYLVLAMTIGLYVCIACVLAYTLNHIYVWKVEKPKRAKIRKDVSVALAQQALTEKSKQPLPLRSNIHIESERQTELR